MVTLMLISIHVCIVLYINKESMSMDGVEEGGVKDRGEGRKVEERRREKKEERRGDKGSKVEKKRS